MARAMAPVRSIPASAGETGPCAAEIRTRQVHPRECGGNSVDILGGRTYTGPSPRVRGKRLRSHRRVVRHRSIPASAGETPAPCGCRKRWWVHPRECGGNLGRTRAWRAASGPSPRVRGKPRSSSIGICFSRSIPASAGETRTERGRPLHDPVHPRECGGNRARGCRSTTGSGPSPRVRGKRAFLVCRADEGRSIPASAGETLAGAGPAAARTVHPRECGGNRTERCAAKVSLGPSPRVRGKHRISKGQVRLGGSIPASAGETRTAGRVRTATWVHPRECGGNTTPRRTRYQIDGPSPRVRGKPMSAAEKEGRSRSIPASAGETAASRAARFAFRVHPRECGGNGPSLDMVPAADGPSPRVRGKPEGDGGTTDFEGSIPASAGETLPPRLDPVGVGVHPRECGGNSPLDRDTIEDYGPSPRVRGKRDGDERRLPLDRSIPASAGETGPDDDHDLGLGVHPRECGGNRLCSRTFSGA